MNADFVKRRYLDPELQRKTSMKEAIEREKEANTAQLVVAEKSAQQQLPIYNSMKSLMPRQDSLMQRNPLPNSTNSNLAVPEVANFFKLHPIPFKE